MDTSDNTCASTDIKPTDSTVAQAAPKCDRCERRKIRERGYAREARLRKKAQAEAEEQEEGEVEAKNSD